MKKSVCALAAVLLLLAVGCDTTTGPGPGADQNGRAAVSLAIAGTSRTVRPDAKLEQVAQWRLRGERMDERTILDQFETNLFDDPEDEILYLDTGDWNFTLEGYTDAYGETPILRETINQMITLGGPNVLEFTVAPIAEGTGTVSITIKLPPGHDITKAKVFKHDEPELDLSLQIRFEGDSIVFEQADHKAGDYYYSFRLFKGEELYGVVSELISVRKNLTSAKTYALGLKDLNLRYVLTYDLNYADPPEDLQPDYYQYTDSAFPLPTATRSGYEFQGWHDNEGLTVTEIGQGSTGDQTFYAQWTPEVYTINYELDNKGTNHAANRLTYTVEDLPLPLKNPTPKEGYTFLRWHIGGYPDNPVTEIPAGSTEEKTLYAKWELVPYTINYELDGKGTNHAGNLLSYTIESPDIILQDPTPSGNFRFGGWYDAEGDPVTQIDQGSTGPKTFYARWDPLAPIETTLLQPAADPALVEQEVFAGDTPMFAAGDYETYQWYWDGESLDGATGPSYTLLGNEEPGIHELFVVVSDSSGEALSARLRVTIKATANAD